MSHHRLPNEMEIAKTPPRAVDSKIHFRRRRHNATPVVLYLPSSLQQKSWPCWSHQRMCGTWQCRIRLCRSGLNTLLPFCLSSLMVGTRRMYRQAYSSRNLQRMAWHKLEKTLLKEWNSQQLLVHWILLSGWTRVPRTFAKLEMITWTVSNLHSERGVSTKFLIPRISGRVCIRLIVGIPYFHGSQNELGYSWKSPWCNNHDPQS